LNTCFQYLRRRRGSVMMTSVFGCRLILTFAPSMVDFVGKLSTVGQQTRPTQHFIPRGRQMSSSLIHVFTWITGM